MISSLVFRVRSLFRRRAMDEALDEEVQSHLRMATQERMKEGEASEQARLSAVREFGNVGLVKEVTRNMWGWRIRETLLKDMLIGARALRRRPGFAVTAVLSLALGIGVTTAIFTVLNAVALRPLPYADAEKLIWMTTILKKNSTDEVTLTGHFLEWRRQNQSFTDLAGYNYQTRNLTGLDEPTQLPSAKASASLLPLLGIQPVLGRNFLKQEDYKGRDQVALLANGLWQQRFGGDPKIVGRTITLDGSPFTVVGILPPDFVFPGPDQVQLITPLGKDEAAELQHKIGSIIVNVIGRLKPGVTFEQARAELTVIQSRLPVPPFRPTITLKMMPLRAFLFGDVKTASLILWAAAGFLLLVACANVSNLLMARWMQRDRELAVRSALGGSRGRLVCHLLTESALLGALACAIGLALAFAARRALLVLSPYRPSALRNLPFDARVLGFGVALGMLTTLFFGLMPAFRVTKVHLAQAMKIGEAAAAGGRGSRRMLSALAAAEIAITLILSTAAGLMLQSFWKLRYTNLGFQPGRLVVATLNIPGSAYREPARRSGFITELLGRAQSLPGVELAAIAAAGDIPPGGGHATNTFAIEGRDQPLGGPRPIARYPAVSPGYFAILGIPLLEGRLLQDSDGLEAPPVTVVNRALVRRYFERENPIGKRIRTGSNDQPWRTIVGVVGDVKGSGLAAPAEPTIYLPYRQADAGQEIGLVMRSPLKAGTVASEVRKMIASLDPNQPVADVQAMSDRLSESVSGPRYTAGLLLAFAGLAIALGLVGVYGVMDCRIRWQLRELAVRQALGAQQRDVIWHVVRQGLAIVLVGLLAGVSGALGLSRLLSGLLYQVSAHDPLTFTLVPAGLVSVALLACCIPAMRVAKSDPAQLLRHE
jgi:putative ABC transport system permease protein